MRYRSRFIRSGLTLTAVALAMRTVSMLFGAFISRAVGAEGMGIYTAVMTVYSFAVTLATSGISLTVTRLVAEAIGKGREGDVGSILRSSAVYSLAFSAISSLALFFGAELIGGSILSDSRTVPAFRILSLSLTGVGLCSVLSGYFIGVRRVGFNAVVQVASQLARMVLTVFLVTKTRGQGIVRTVSALCIGITLTELLSLVLVFAEFMLDRRLHPTRAAKKTCVGVKDVASAAIPLGVSSYVRSVLTTIEHILIPKRLIGRGESGEEAYSHYGLLHGMALPVVLYPMSPLSSFSGLLVPEFASDFARADNERMSRVASEALNTTLSYSAVVAVLLYVFSEELGYVIYGSYDVGGYISMLAPIIPIMYLDHVTDNVLKGIGEQVYSMWVNIADSLLSVALVFFLIPVFGITGYALVIIIMEGFNFVLSLTRLTGKIRIKLHFLKSLVSPLCCSLAAGKIADALFLFGGSTSPAPWIVLKVLFTLCLIFAFIGAARAIRPVFHRKRSDKSHGGRAINCTEEP
ncbi:MAG: oligosaccharide flippase family protein [Clostridia bacterium]|nr:oligosaccharide flippase family protein [Clostridia bacterium]